MITRSRREFLASVAAGVGASSLAGCRRVGVEPGADAPTPAPATVMDLRAPALDRVRVGLIGLGERGSAHVDLLAQIDDIEILALSDPHEDVLDRALGILTRRGRPPAQRIAGDELSYRELLARPDLDAVVISTPWRWHAPMALEAMEAGKHAFVEVPLATSIEDLWTLVDAAERTRRHCMMLENVCYGREELMVLNMVSQGLFGELTHGEAAYVHELRWQMKQVEHKTGSWRTYWHTKRDANLYPTHGLGPVAQYMGINRGDRFDYLSSMSGPALGRAAYARREFSPEHERNTLDYICGDINTTVVKTVAGRTIMVQHDTTTPRPYTRHNLIQGTHGAFAGFPGRIALDPGDGSGFHAWDTDMAPWRERYDHPLWLALAETDADGQPTGGHGGMDYVMLRRIVDRLRAGEALDQSVYDGAAWSAIGPLSAASVADRSNSQDVPDFTRGVWRETAPLA